MNMSVRISIVLIALWAMSGLPANGAAPPASQPAWVTDPFSGKNLDGWETRPGARQENRWRVGKAELDPADPRKLVAQEGGSDLVNVIAQTQGVDLVSKARWSDCRLEVEVMLAKGSNSGIYLMGIYEVQLLDGINNRTSPRGNMGAVYGVSAPSYFPAKWLSLDYYGKDKEKEKEWTAWVKSDEYTQCVSKVLKPPGQWQQFVIDFRVPRYDAKGAKIAEANFERITLNGVVIQENVPVSRGTGGGGPSGRTEAPIMLQGNHGPVAFRNIRVTPLPPVPATQPAKAEVKP